MRKINQGGAPMKTLPLTCGVFPSDTEARQKMWIMFASCRKYQIDLQMYGVGRTFPAYKTMMLDWQLEYLRTVPAEYTHVLFTDGWDAFFTAGLETIERKYRDLGSPDILISAFYQLANVSDVDLQYPNCFDTSKRYCYPNRGGYLAKREAIIDAFERMLALPRQTGDDCFNHYDAWQEGWYRPMLDSDCQIFQIADDDTVVREHDGTGEMYLLNTATGSLPCVWHHSGGYTDQVTGKDERMKPWASRLGII